MFSTKLLFTVLVVLYYCTTVSSDQYYVVATDCQPGDGECHPLSFYVAHSSSYFTDNTIFYFKEGIHTVMDQIIYVIGVQNVSFIGSNQYVVINSTFPYNNTIGNAFNIYYCTNISIVNITIVCEICDILNYYKIDIAYSHDIAIVNVNNSMGVYNSFDITVYNSYITVFNGLFDTSVHCYDTLQFHNLQVINSTLANIELIIQHDTSYVLNVTLDNIILMKTDASHFHKLYLYSNSFYSVNIINTSSYGFIYVIFTNYNYNASCQYPNTSIPIDSVVITNSYFFDKLSIQFISSVSNSNNQMISINSCSIHNGLFIINHIYYQTLTMVSILIVNTQLSFFTNYINKIENIIFSNVSISNCLNTGLELSNSKLTINGSLTVLNNSGVNGGGMSLYGNCVLEIYPNSKLIFSGNHAANKGGGIYREIMDEDICDIIPNRTNVSFYFINNTAVIGDDIYGIEFASVYCSIDMSIFKTHIKYLAPPYLFCFCTNNSISNCTPTMPRLCKFPEQKIYFNVIITDYNRNITTGLIIRYLNDTYIDTIQIGPKCTELSYTATVNSSAVNYTLNIYLPISFYISKLIIPFSILPCPIGFTHTHGICTCSSSITAENVTCDIDTLQISHKGQLWIGPYNTSITFSADQPNHHNICLINEQCLLCNPSNVSFMLNDTDPQCQQHKSGTLCGTCTTGYSLVLGSDECMECTTNYNMALIINLAARGRNSEVIRVTSPR